jgi:riboflavin-specific deaminase-like protein
MHMWVWVARSRVRFLLSLSLVLCLNRFGLVNSTGGPRGDSSGGLNRFGLVSSTGVPHGDTYGWMSADETIQSLIHEVQEWHRQCEAEISSRPFVTATFAQSLDGYLTPYVGHNSNQERATARNFCLSGPGSQRLTHALRSIHDGILIGGRTLTVDNPRLTNRLWSRLRTMDVVGCNDTLQFDSPRPIVLDSKLEHVFRLGPQLQLQRPIVCCSAELVLDDGIVECCRMAGASILPCQSTIDGKLDLHDVLRQLKQRFGMRHIMVEGGALVLSSFFAESLVDGLVVTVVPKILHSGLAVSFVKQPTAIDASSVPLDLTSCNPRFVSLGRDAILLSRYLSHATSG